LKSFINSVAIMPNKTPKITAPPVSSINRIEISMTPILPPLHNSILIVNRIMHVPSFSKLYPSIRELNFFGAPASFSKAKTATVSVQERIDPNMNA